MIKVGISGANGTMGRLTIGAIESVDDLTIDGLYAPGRDGQDILGYSASSDPLALSGCDVVIELTNPSAADDNVPRWRDSGADVLIGTSGYTVARIDALRNAWSGLTSRCLVVPNFAVGAVLMMRFAELAAPHFESAEIVETHHHDKPDAPSGTALHTAARMAAARKQGAHSRGTEIGAGSLGGDAEGIPVHSLRLHGATNAPVYLPHQRPTHRPRFRYRDYGRHVCVRQPYARQYEVTCRMGRQACHDDAFQRSRLTRNAALPVRRSASSVPHRPQNLAPPGSGKSG